MQRCGQPPHPLAAPWLSASRLASPSACIKRSFSRGNSYVDLEDRVPAKHPLRVIRCIVNDVLAALDGEFAKIYAESGRPSIPPERLLRPLLLQAFYTIRSEMQLMEQLDYNLLLERV
jgi:transposase